MHSLRDYYCGCLYVEEHKHSEPYWIVIAMLRTTKLWVFEHAPNQISVDQIAC